MVIYTMKLIRNFLLISLFLLTHMLQLAFADFDDLAVKWAKIQDAKGLSPNLSAIISGDNNLIIIGESYSDKRYGFWIIKYDASGRQLLKKEYQVEVSLSDFNIQETKI